MKTWDDRFKEAWSFGLTLTDRSPSEVYSLLDLTRLKKDTDESDVASLYTLGEAHHVAALCMYPDDLQHLPSACTIPRAVVINFPYPKNNPHENRKQIEQLGDSKSVEEIDFVFNYIDYLEGLEAKAINEFNEIRQVCQNYQLTLKVILETGAFNSIEAIYRLGSQLVNEDCGFLKTSTGKTSPGVTPQSAYALAEATKGTPTGIKLSGGIRTLADAQNYTHLIESVHNKKADKNWYRLGVSQLPQ